MKFNIISEICHLCLAGIIATLSLFLKNVWVNKIAGWIIYLPNRKEGIGIITNNILKELTLINIKIALGVLICGFVITYFDRILHRKINFVLLLSYFILLFLGLLLIVFFNGFTFGGELSEVYFTDPNINLFSWMFFTPEVILGSTLVVLSVVFFLILLLKSRKKLSFD